MPQLSLEKYIARWLPRFQDELIEFGKDLQKIEENPQEHQKDYEAFVRDFNWFQARFYFFAVNIGIPENQIKKPKQEIIDKYIEQTEHGIRLKDIRFISD